MSAQGGALDGGENQENVPARVRGAHKSRLENQENITVNKPSTRTVLGALGNNARRQPGLRGSKQQVSVGLSVALWAASQTPSSLSVKCPG